MLVFGTACTVTYSKVDGSDVEEMVEQGQQQSSSHMDSQEPDDVFETLDGQKTVSTSEDAQDSDDEILVHSGMSLRTSQKSLDYYSLYSNKPFLQPATQYSRTLARMSICMATCANRPIPYDSDVVLKPDQYLVQYLNDCGFTNLREDDYDKTPSLYTVATAMGQKTLTDENGEPFTLIAVGVCGGNYKLEWLSNVTLGTGVRHKGFDSAARMVTDRIFGYIGSNHITGRIKIWIAGFSRAAAVSNVTAANLVDSQEFNKDDIFAYTFATPRTTKDYGPDGYENIFNITGPMDMIPQVAPAAWGFGRYGVDLCLPGQELDSNFAKKYALVQKGFEEDFESLSNYNPKINLCLRLAIGMFEELVPGQESYDNSAQETILSLLADKSPQNILRVLRKLTVATKDDSQEQRMIQDQMVEFLGSFATSIIMDNQYEERVNMGTLGSRVFHEHIEDLYLMWMNVPLSTEELLGGTNSFTYLLTLGDPALVVEDASTGEKLYEIDGSGNVNGLKGENDTAGNLVIDKFVNSYIPDRIMMMALPHDADYRITWDATKATSETLHVWTIPSTPAISPEYQTYYWGWDLSQNKQGVAYEAHGDQIETAGSKETSLASSDIAFMIGLCNVEDGWRNTIARGVMRICLVLILLRAIVAAINRRGSDELWQFRFICSSIVMLGLVESEVAYWLFAANPMTRFIWKAIAGAAVLGYCICCRRKGSKQFWRIFAAMVLCTAGDLAINFWFLPGVVLFGLAHVFLIWLFQKVRPLPGHTWFWWGLISLVAVLASLPITASYATPIRVGVAIYAPILLLLLMAGSHQKGNLNLGSFLFVVSDCMLAFYFTHQQYPYAHMAYMALYYLALLILCRSLIDEDVIVAPGARFDPLRNIRRLLGKDKKTEDQDESDAIDEVAGSMESLILD